MNRHRLFRARVRKAVALFAFALSASLLACVQPAEQPGGNIRIPAKGGPIRIGLSMDTLKEERWQRDRDLFVERAKELGAEGLVQSATGDDTAQTNQAQTLLA